MTIIKQLNEALENRYFLTEGKQDYEKFVAFAGEDLAARFKKLKDADRIHNDKDSKKNYADYEYWEKLPVEELKDFVTNLENTKTRGMSKKGAECIYDEHGWKIYRIDTYDAAKYYGENTKWCITGRYDGEEEKGEEHFNGYKSGGVENYYFLIPDNDPFGKWCYLEYPDSKKRNNNQNNVFFRSDDTGYPFMKVDTVARKVPPEVLKHLPYLEDYKVYHDRGNIEVTYTSGPWKIYKALNDFAAHHYLGYFMDQPYAKKPETYYFIIKGRTPKYCYYYFPTLREAEENTVFIEVGKSIGSVASELSDMMRRVPMDVLRHLPHIDKICEDAERFDNSVKNGVLVYTDDLALAPIRLMKNMVTKVIIPNTITHLANHVFSSIESLREVEFEDGSALEEISNGAFGYTHISEIVIPKTVKKIGDYAFCCCDRLDRIRFEEGTQIKEIGTSAFSHSRLKALNIPASLKTIGNFAFSSCAFLTYVLCPKDSQLTEIKEFAFDSCCQLDTANLPKTLQILGSSVFYKCQSLKDVSIEENSDLSFIGDHVFGDDCGLRNLTLPASLMHIGRYAFDCTPVMHITIHGKYRPSIFSQDCGLNLASEIDWVDAGKKTTWGELKY